MPASVAVYTAVFGGHDALQEPEAQDIDVDLLCFTDDHALGSSTWRVIHEAPRHDDPRLAAKVHKLVPADVLDGYRWALWVDANLVIDNRSFVREAIEAASRSGSGMTTYQHPLRDCIYDEAQACADLPKCAGQPVREQVASYRAEGHPAHAGLYGCGSIAWDLTSRPAHELGRRWLAECERWTTRDQLSLPVVARRLGVRPGVFPHHLFRHRPTEALICWLGQHGWGSRLLDRGRAASGRLAAVPSRQPVPYRWWTVGNPWFDVAPHRRNG